MLCTGVLIVASLFSVVKNYLANPPPEPQTPIEIVEEVQKGTKVCKGHAYRFSNPGNREGFAVAKKDKEYFDESLPYNTDYKSFGTEIFRNDRKEWVCRLTFVHVDNCTECDEYDLVDQEDSEDEDATPEPNHPNQN